MGCNFVIGAIGSSPNTSLVEGLQNTETKALIVNERMQTSDPNIYAMGDIIATKSILGEYRRLPHVDNARATAKQAADAACGANPSPFNYTPFFYCRIFEYSASPFAFNFFGEKAGEPVVETSHTANRVRALWSHDGRVVGAMIMSTPVPTDEDRRILRHIVEWRPRSRAVDKIFACVSSAS